MADLTLGTVAVTDARISMPRVGTWTADLTLDSDTVPTGAQTLATSDGALSLVGTVQNARSGTWEGHTTVRVVGGAGGLSTVLEPRFYADATVGIVLQDIARECGEVLSDTCDAATLATSLARWTRRAGPGGLCIALVLEGTGCPWRVLADGTVWVGPETWPNVEVPGELTDEQPRAGTREVACDTLYMLLAPGCTWDGRRVSRVEHRMGAVTARTTAWFEVAGQRTSGDRATNPLEALVRSVMRETLYHALFAGTVIGVPDPGDEITPPSGSYAVTLDSPLFPTLVDIPWRFPTPGHTATVATGARVLVAFEGGDPLSPVLVGFAPGTELERFGVDASQVITLEAPAIRLGAGATKAVGLAGDGIARSTLFGQWMSQVEAFIGGAVTPIPSVSIGTLTASAGKLVAE